MQDQRDERQSPTAVLTGGHELADCDAELRGRSIPDQPSGTLHDVGIAQHVDLRFDFLDTPAQSRRESCDVEHGIGIAVKEHEDIPRQKRSDVALNELRDRGP